ncbi:hypothetical protein ACFOSC_27400 [Streptantibioticus rubrisoli]|uniref:Uncharacterized protein n=1 Tax=Streptantibioticus rubrisoli TaxID=1387313 RepID=A0ABT1PAB0_9ACTN|nr:hypothetical protein [Streptantibioticus rubrisoli]MCQ4042308.1 hypothetical protein [Streptantibioticus rubrisoli]
MAHAHGRDPLDVDLRGGSRARHLQGVLSAQREDTRGHGGWPQETAGPVCPLITVGPKAE